MDGLTVDKLLMMAQTGELEQLLSTTASQSPGYKCETCKDTGWLHFEDEQGYRSGKECDCRLADKARRRIARSGLQHVIEEWTFDAFETVTDTQKAMKDIAMRYAEALLAGGKEWLFMGGQVGSGKSHLCTAVCGVALHNNRQVRYMQWVDDGRRLKAMVNDDAYEDLVEPWLNADILYIDDLFKMQHRPGDRARPTDADIRAAFSIINGRYVQDKPTIITSEWLLSSDLLAADGGTFSRVYQKCRDYLCEISPGSEKNYRLRGAGA